METKNREKMLLIAVGVCVALWMANFLIVTPLSSSWSARQEEIKKLKSTIRQRTYHHCLGPFHRV